MKNSPPGNPESEVKEDHNHDLGVEATADQAIDQELLLNAVKRWVAYRLSSFREWEFDEIVNEAFVHAHELISRKYKGARGSINTFLRSRLYSPVATRYQKANNIVVTRDVQEDGRVGPRKYERRFFSAMHGDVGGVNLGVSDQFIEPGWLKEFRGYLGPDTNMLVSFIMQGKTQRQIQAGMNWSAYIYHKKIRELRNLIRFHNLIQE